MRLSKLIFILILIFGMADSQAEERSELHLFQYGRTNTELLKTAFFDFRDMLSEKLPWLSIELSRNADIPAVTHLKLKSVLNENGVLERPEVRVGSLADKRLYWLQTGALCVLTGNVRQRDGIPYIHTTFFWGELKGPYGDEMITLKLPVTGKALDSTYNSHSVAILYALAHEVKQKCPEINESLYLLSEAHKHAKAISIDFPGLGAELEALVTKAINEIKEGCNE